MFYLSLGSLPENEGALIVFPNISMVTILDDDRKAGREGEYTHTETLRILSISDSTRDTYTQCRVLRSEFLRLSVSNSFDYFSNSQASITPRVVNPLGEKTCKAGRDHGNGHSHAGSL